MFCLSRLASTYVHSKFRKLTPRNTPSFFILPTHTHTLTFHGHQPPPPPKAETKWEKFAKEKGIGQNKSKRSRKVWDEATGEWVHRHGYQRADKEEWPIREVKGDPYADPWEQQREAKRARTDQNRLARMRNQERAGNLAKGTTNRVMSSKLAASSSKVGKHSTISSDVDLGIPVGVPVDLKSLGRKKVGATQSNPKHQRGQTLTMAALIATQRSTASLGKFDKLRQGEPERKASVTKKRASTFSTADASETERSLKLLQSLAGDAVAKEKARKKGRLATGETAYDFDFDGSSTTTLFRKKKGRAGAGKMKKMTKKRAGSYV